MPLLVMLSTAKMNSRFDFHVVIGYLKEDLSIENISLVSAVLEILDIDFEFRSILTENVMFNNAHISRTSFVRLVLFEELCGVVLWLDADLVCLSNWDEVISLNLHNTKKYLVGGVVDPIVANPNFQQNSKNLAAITMGASYFNSGVILVNCDIWKESKMPSEWRLLASHYEEFGFQFSDQCILNYLVRDRFFLIPPSYNRILLAHPRLVSENDRILHFAGPDKPWHYSKRSLRPFFGGVNSREIFRYISVQEKIIQRVFLSNEILGEILRRKAVSIRLKPSFFLMFKQKIVNNLFIN